MHGTPTTLVPGASFPVALLVGYSGSHHQRRPVKYDSVDDTIDIRS